MELRTGRSESCYSSEMRTSKKYTLKEGNSSDDLFLSATPIKFRWFDLELQCALNALSPTTNGFTARELP